MWRRNTELSKIHRLAAATKTVFLANISHELRTPLNGIVGMMELLEDNATGKYSREYVKIIEYFVEILLDMIGDILDFATIEENKINIEYSEFHIKDLLIGICPSCVSSYNTPVTANSVNCILDISNTVPKSVQGDPVRVQQIITNLLSNAFKFTDYGSIKLSVSCEKSLDDTDFLVTYRVKDSGIGMSPKNKERLFTSFTQLHKGRSVGGTGVGLVICKNLCLLMGGDLSCESIEDSGTTFDATIRLKSVKDTNISDDLDDVSQTNFNHTWDLGKYLVQYA